MEMILIENAASGDRFYVRSSDIKSMSICRVFTGGDSTDEKVGVDVFWDGGGHTCLIFDTRDAAEREMDRMAGAER